MLYAVTIEPLNAIFFVSERPDGDEWEVQQEVSLDVPANYAAHPRDAEPPEQVLCRSTVDHNHFRVYNHLRDVDTAAFQPVGRHFGGIFSKSSWDRFVNQVPGALRVLDICVDEPPGATEEAVAAIKRRD
ncbi:MAG TPA: hypothetical protein VKA15_16070 [Isosphaeraceae bacterium]|nr:hypothetical protein [Isosphaeraceae bacterium]